MTLATRESGDMITRDTVITIAKTVFVARITTSKSDTAARPCFFMIPGKGEINIDTNILKKNTRLYGQHYWLDHGWDGSVTIGNGKHYTNLITICPSVANVRPAPMRALIDFLIKAYNLKMGSLHFAGLSMGGYTWGRFLCNQPSPGDEHNMSLMKSFVSLEGNANDLSVGYNLPGWASFGHWAVKYDGRYFGLQGTADGQDPHSAAYNMRDSGRAGNAYFSMETLGGGKHCCWNDMLNLKNWLSGSQIGKDTRYPNQPGNYKDSESIYEWMFRQGDTNFAAIMIPVPDTTAVVKKYPQVATGEYVTGFLDTIGHWSGVGAVDLLGPNPNPLGIPTNIVPGQTFAGIFGGLHNQGAFDSAGYVYMIGDNWEGQLGIGDTLARKGMVVKILIDSAGNEFKDVIKVVPYYLYGTGVGYYAIKRDGTLWHWGNGKGGMRGDGTPGRKSTRPVQVNIGPVKDIAAGYIAIALLMDGTIRTWGGAGSSFNLGYAATGTDYQTPHQLGISGIEGIAGGIYFHWAYKKDSLFSWGIWGNYQGSSGAIGKPTYAAAIMKVLPAPIVKMTTISVASYFLLQDSTLWSCGDNAQGDIGNGKELDYSLYRYAWDFKIHLMQVLPVKVLDNVMDISGSSVYTFYAYATKYDGSLWAWGRNKGAVIANGIVPCSPDESGKFQNSWDVPTPQLVNPSTLKKTIVTPSLWCIANPTISPCNQCKIIQPVPQPVPADTIPATIDQSYSPGTIILVAPVKDTTGYTFKWSKITGGSVSMNPIIYSQDIIKGLKPGIYKFNLRITDKNGIIKNTVFNITIN